MVLRNCIYDSKAYPVMAQKFNWGTSLKMTKRNMQEIEL